MLKMCFGKINFSSATYLLLMIKRKIRICVVIILNWKFKFTMFYILGTLLRGIIRIRDFSLWKISNSFSKPKFWAEFESAIRFLIFSWKTHIRKEAKSRFLAFFQGSPLCEWKNRSKNDFQTEKNEYHLVYQLLEIH